MTKQETKAVSAAELWGLINPAANGSRESKVDEIDASTTINLEDEPELESAPATIAESTSSISESTPSTAIATTVNIESTDSSPNPIIEAAVTSTLTSVQTVALGNSAQFGITKKIKLIQAQNGATYAVREINGNRYVLQVGSRKLNNILRELASKDGVSLRKSDLNDLNESLKAYAETAGVVENVWYRYAPIPGGIEIDLGDEHHTRVRITADRVEYTTTGSNTLFYRSQASLPLAMPAKVGNLQLIKKYLNLDPVSALLFIAWLTYTIAHPKLSTTKFMILVLQGGEGTGKSFLCNNIILKLIDPNVIGVQTLPSNNKDLAIAGQNAHVLCYDNLRDLKQSMADTLCIASTGGAMTTRQLYTDADQQIIHLHVALVLNGIHSFIDQPDLAQRCLPLQLKPITGNNRKSESVMIREFNADIPAILRGLYDLIANIFMHLPSVEVTNPERMLDFVAWLAAMEKVEGIPAGIYQGAYSEALQQGRIECLYENILATAIIEFTEHRLKNGQWIGSPNELLIDLNRYSELGTQRSRDWPQNAISLSKRIIPLQASLLAQGISIEMGRGKNRTIKINVKGDM